MVQISQSQFAKCSGSLQMSFCILSESCESIKSDISWIFWVIRLTSYSTGNNILNPGCHHYQIISLFGGHFKFPALSWYIPKNPVGHNGWEMKKMLQFRSSKTTFHNILFKNIAPFFSKFCLLTLKKPSFSQCVFNTSQSIDISQNRNKHARLK